MITKEDAIAFVKQLEELKAEQQLKEERGPLDLTRRIDELEAENKTLREAIVSHVTMMVTRLQEGKNPEVIIQSPTLDALIEVYDEIETGIELTEMVVKVIQTSANPDVVGLLQTHAAEVSDMSKRGMQAVH